MRCRAFALLALALSASPAAADCFAVTRSADKVLRAKFTPSQYKRAEAAGTAAGYCRIVVADGTPGAVDVPAAKALLPEIRGLLATINASERQAKRSKPNARPLKARQRIAKRRAGRAVGAVPMPRSRPVSLPTAALQPEGVAPPMMWPLHPLAPLMMPASRPPDEPQLAIPIGPAPDDLPPELTAPPNPCSGLGKVRRWLCKHW